MKKLSLLVVLCLLTACAPVAATLTPHPTVTAAPSGTLQRFTVRIEVGAVDVIRKDTIYLGAIKINYVADEQGNVRAPIDYTSPICYVAPGNVCQEQGAADLLVNGVMLSIETGCWTANISQGMYSNVQPCDSAHSAASKPLFKPLTQSTTHTIFLPFVVSSCSMAFVEWVWTQPYSEPLHSDLLNCWRILYPFNPETGTYQDENGNPAPPLCAPNETPDNPWESVFNTSNCA